MRKCLLLLLLAGPTLAATPLRFWNLTGDTIKELRLAPVGSDQFGPNQCANDPDGTVDSDERLRLDGVAPGHYDVKLTFKSGRMCMARDVALRGDGKYAFSLEAKDLKECR